MNELGVGNSGRELELFSFHHTDSSMPSVRYSWNTKDGSDVPCEVDVEKVDVETCLHQASDNSNGIHISLCPVPVPTSIPKLG